MEIRLLVHNSLFLSSLPSAYGGDPVAQHSAAIEAARQAGVERIVYTSQMAASASSAFPPMWTHAATETMLANSGVAWTALRNGFYADAALRFMGTRWQQGRVAAPADGKVAWTIKILSDRSQTRIKYASKLERNFVKELENMLGHQIKYTCLTKQFSIWNKHLNQICFYDITDSAIKKIIEFNGDYWHCRGWKPTDVHPHNNQTAKQIWEHDFQKKLAAEERGFCVKIVWEGDYINSKENVLKECAAWMKNIL
ncbi:Uncharacterised protein [uncultured archaeon]|nr:Uncharacterised protein [uncultured archaeon]